MKRQDKHSIKFRDEAKKVISAEDASTISKHLYMLPDDSFDPDLAAVCDEIYLGNEYREMDDQEIQENWREFRREYQSNPKPAYRRPGLLIATILLGLILATSVCVATGFLPWKLDIQWDDEQFHVLISENTGLNHEPAMHTGYDPDVENALVKHEIGIGIPTWIPDGFELIRIDDTVNPDYGTILDFIYINGDKNLSISVTRYTYHENSLLEMDVERDEEEIEVVRHGDTDIYLYSNLAYQNAMWFEQPYFVMITGNIERGVIVKMIDSIEWE